MEQVQNVKQPSFVKQFAKGLFFCTLLVSAFFLGKVNMVSTQNHQKVVSSYEVVQKGLFHENSFQTKKANRLEKELDEEKALSPEKAGSRLKKDNEGLVAKVAKFERESILAQLRAQFIDVVYCKQ